ncbi:MAG: hypothetical protein K0S67_369 [Nitrososphaeraceae archaeon]|jgi:hypothetical protein|nr:hypothetical protein [Nitrososphaeraceae archaeon]MCD6036485.1 hypothetical protein [Nitrososphaeraceae archaeon]MDF2767745.1 hypothetical protein [Nitrososphaeraceae archaeon]
MTKRNSIFVLAGLIGALLLLPNLLIAELLPTIINNLLLILTISKISKPAVAQVSLKEDSSVEINNTKLIILKVKNLTLQ